GRNVVVAFDVGLAGEVEVAPVGHRFAGEGVFQVLLGLGAFQVAHDITSWRVAGRKKSSRPCGRPGPSLARAGRMMKLIVSMEHIAGGYWRARAFLACIAVVSGGVAAGCASSSSGGSCRRIPARRFRNSSIAELLRQTIAMRRLGGWPLNSIRCRPSTGATGGFTAITGSRVMPTFAATIWRSVSRLVARKPPCSPAPDRWQTSSAWSRRQWPSSSSSRFWLDRSRSLSRPCLWASGCSSETASRNGSSNRNSLCMLSSCRGRARMPASSRPSRSRRRSASVFSSTSSSSSFGNAARTSGSACGSRYGPSVGKMPSRTVPDSGSSVRRATARICSTPPSTSRARIAMSRPTSVSSTLRGVRSTSGTPSSSSSFLIWVDRVGWLTKQASAARPKCRCSARATRYWRSRRFIGESVQAIVINYGTDANNQLEQYAGAPYRAPRIPVIPRASESLPLPRRRAGCTPPARACPRRRFFLRAAPRAGRADRAFWHCVGSHADPYGGALWIAWGFPDASSCPSTRVHRTGQLLGRRVRRHGRPGAAGPVAWLGGAAVVSDRVQGGSRTAGFFRYHHDQGEADQGFRSPLAGRQGTEGVEGDDHRRRRQAA